MKILFFSRLFYPHIGGVEKHVWEVSKILIKKGHKITVVTERNLSSLKLKENIDGISIYRIPNLKEGKFKKIKIWIWFLKNINLVRRADIVHCHDVFFWYLPFRFLFPFKKIFTTFHGYESFPLKPKNIFIHKISEKLSNGNICVGDFIKKWYGTKPTFVTYGGVTVSDKRELVNKNQNQNSAVFIGRLDEQTGIKTYVDAVTLIKKKIPNFKFTIVGNGKFRKDVGDNFDVLGFKKNPEKYFQKYNFAFVSRYLSILEAMAAKRLVFAVYDNSIKEDYLKMVPFAKYIIICNSSFELVSAISFYLKSAKAKEDMITNAYAWVKNQTWEKMANMYSKLWV